MASTRRTDFVKRSPPQASNQYELFDRQPPFDLTAESGVLGSMMLMPDVIDDVALELRADDFYDDANRRVFEHMLALHDAGSKVDPVLLTDRLKTAGDLELIGGPAYLARIMGAVANAAHAVHYAKIVRAKSTFRSLITASTEILREAYDQSLEPKQMLSSAEQKIFSILDSRGSNTISSIAEILHHAMDRMEARLKGEHTSGGVDTGFSELDALMGGLHNSELIILAARPSMGKTAFAMNIAEHAAFKQRAPVLFVSLEMSGIELADRMLCSIARVNSHQLRNGTISKDDRQKLVQTASDISQGPLFVDDSPSRTMTEIAAAARRIRRREQGLGLIVIDYLQLIEPDNPRDPRQEQVARIARRLKGLAREMKVPVLCLAQLNRQAEDSKDHVPRLSHLRESGAIEQDADVVMFVHREEYYHRGEDRDAYAGQAEIHIAKQRNGPVGQINLAWLKDFTRFEDRAPDRLQEFDDFNDPQAGAPASNF